HLDRLRSIRQSAEVRKEQLAVAKTFDSMLQKITDFEHCYTQIRLQAAHLWSLITPDGQENFNQLAQDPNEEVHSETLIRLPEFFRPPHQSYEEILSKLLVPYARELSALRRSCKAISNVLKAAPKTTAFSQLEERISNFTYLQDLGNQAAMASGFRGPLESDIIMLSKAVDRISSFKVQKEAFSDKGILNDPASAVLTTLRGVVLDGAVSALNDQAVIQANFLVFSTCLSVTFAGLIFREAEKDAIVFAQVKNELARLQHQKLRNVLSDQFLRLDPSLDPKVFQKTRMEQFNRERLELVGGPLGLCLLEILQAHQQDTLASNSEHFKRRLARFKVADQHDPRIVPLLSQHMTGPLFSEEAAQQFADQVLPLVFFDPNREVPISADAIDPDEQAFVTQVLIDDYHVDDKIAAQIASSLTMTSVQDIISAVSETFASISFPPNAASTWLTNNVKFWNLPNKQQKQHLSRIEEVYSKVWSSNLASLPYYSDLDARIGDLGLRTLEILAKKVDRNLHGLD
ncbi:MAG: hypothetical protein KDD62_02770, partial [Bdellovibrionales bacterium]|nr:hypothetical protein [Bdellovibrionales bacterium]